MHHMLDVVQMFCYIQLLGLVMENDAQRPIFYHCCVIVCMVVFHSVTSLHRKRIQILNLDATRKRNETLTIKNSRISACIHGSGHQTGGLGGQYRFRVSFCPFVTFNLIFILIFRIFMRKSWIWVFLWPVLSQHKKKSLTLGNHSRKCGAVLKFKAL